MKFATTFLLATAMLLASAGHAADAAPAANEVQKDLESILSDCEKRKLPAEEEIACIEKGYLQFMGVAVEEEPADAVKKE
jgi:hypothetical protein